ncbi:MAG TPA: DUF1207 domain-containing protein [Spirochaetota bacterium]|nr:DUF1207 domain-containing protein [Spirochaetota bacterium]HPC41914.1 DUF1207 domain-containing protein [Spirochaetota bacterium]HPL17358.1 DUF1207 domain-containing protein [Spirochaetota bacterium]HQF09624.1 DUF1207 domain-containing protein [Spirochaetota bacterium]HQH98306.1 DUF1207 domain-containing protein [Spirochaetota bacterium]
MARDGIYKKGLIFCFMFFLAALTVPVSADEDAGKQSGEKKALDRQIRSDADKTTPGKKSFQHTLSETQDEESRERGTGLFPGSRLYPAAIADPRRVAFSGGLRYHDDAFNRFRTRYGTDSHVLGSDNMFGAVSLGSRLPLYRWDVVKGYLQADVEGCVWALFAFKKPSGWLGDASTLLNADYYLGFITSYAYGGLAIQLRFWHMSSHLGDEFLVLYPEIWRKNVSIEGIDIFASYAIVSQVRLYLGIGCIYHSFKDSRFDPFYLEYGAEIRPFNAIGIAKNVRFQPFIAAHLKNWQNNHFALNGNYSIGMEFAAYRGSFSPKMQLYFTFSHGPSQEGQFYNFSTTYYSLTLTFQMI